MCFKLQIGSVQDSLFRRFVIYNLRGEVILNVPHSKTMTYQLLKHFSIGDTTTDVAITFMIVILDDALPTVKRQTRSTSISK